jgi:hypothetical protein
MKIVTRRAGRSGTKSTAPCTVAKSPLPSAATTSRVLSAAGGVWRVPKVQRMAWACSTPASTVTW